MICECGNEIEENLKICEICGRKIIHKKKYRKKSIYSKEPKPRSIYARRPDNSKVPNPFGEPEGKVEIRIG